MEMGMQYDRINRIARRILSSYDENTQDYFMEAQKNADPAIAECIPMIAIKSVMIPGLTGRQIKSLTDLLASLDASYAPYLENGRVESIMRGMASSNASLDNVQSPEILLKGTGSGDIEEIQAFNKFINANLGSMQAMDLIYYIGEPIEQKCIVHDGAVLSDDKYQEVLDDVNNYGDAMFTVGKKTQDAFKDKFIAKFIDDFHTLEGGGLTRGWLDGKNGRNLKLMASSNDEFVRAYAAGNERTPVAALKKLARDKSNLVRYRAGNNLSLPADIYVDYDSSDIPEQWQA